MLASTVTGATKKYSKILKFSKQTLQFGRKPLNYCFFSVFSILENIDIVPFCTLTQSSYIINSSSERVLLSNWQLAKVPL